MKKVLVSTCTIGFFAIGSMCVSPTEIHAALITSVFDSSWTEFQSLTEDDKIEDGNVDPGVGGQAFDAEYLLYKREGNILSIGLQTGFDLSDGVQPYPVNTNTYYYAGDLALSFDDSTDSYEYAFDFGLLTKDYSGDLVDADAAGSSDGIDTEGLYAVTDTGWNDDVYSGHQSFDGVLPFAMNDGTIVENAMESNTYNQNAINGSFYRIVELDLSQIAGLDLLTGLTLSAHWTMSCGNDAINGTAALAPVPEPASMLLFGTGFVGLLGMARKKRKK